MKKNLMKYGFYLIFLLVLYFGMLPFSLTIEGLHIIALLVLLPLLLLAGSGVWGYFYGFDIIPPLMVGLLFVPPVYLFMNDTALIYALAYAIVSLAGVGIGAIIKNYTKK